MNTHHTEPPARTLGRIYATVSTTDAAAFVAGREQVPGVLAHERFLPTAEAVEDFCRGWEDGGGPPILAALVD